MNMVEKITDKMGEMIISVIIPTYNSSDTIKDCIESIKKQDYKGRYEIIIVDNGSIDDTITKVRSMGIENIIISPNTTVYGSRNLAIKNSKGNIIALLDSDCVASTQWLTSGVNGLKHSDIIAGKIIPKESGKTMLYYYDKYVLWDEPERNKGDINIAAGNAFIKRTVFEELNGFREDIATAGDSVFSTIAKEKGYKIIFSENAVVSHPVDKIGKKIRGIFREGYGAQIKSPYKYKNKSALKKVIQRIMQMMQLYKGDIISIYGAWKEKEININILLGLVLFSIFMRSMTYLSILSSIYLKPISGMISRR